jgi:hypothetical protein
MSRFYVWGRGGGGSLPTPRASAKHRLLPLRANGCYARNRGGGLYRQTGANSYCRIFGLVEVENRPKKYANSRKLVSVQHNLFKCTGVSTKYQFHYFRPKVGGPQISSMNRKSANLRTCQICYICIPSTNVAIYGFADQCF